MRVFVTGVNGQLGHDVVNELYKRGYEATGSDIQDTCPNNMPYVKLDITDKEEVNKIITNYDVIIHCAAWTAVDMAEDDDKVELVRRVNAEGARNIAEACKNINAKMVYISTDYVFDGQGTKPWSPDCSSVTIYCAFII